MFSTFFSKVGRRLLRNQLLNAFWTRIEDRCSAVMFYLNAESRRAAAKRLEQCQNVDDHYEFAVECFGPHQIKIEITEFLKMARNEKPRHVCEIGTASGGTNFLLSHALPDVSLMMGVDLFVRNKSRLRYFMRQGQQFYYLDGSSYAAETVEKAKRLLAGRQLDVLFIDGDHSYLGVKEDFLCYKQFVREGGLIAFHDIITDYSTRYGQHTGRYGGDVPFLWEKIKPCYPFYEFVQDKNQDGLGIGVIRYSSKVKLPDDL